MFLHMLRWTFLVFIFSPMILVMALQCTETNLSQLKLERISCTRVRVHRGQWKPLRILFLFLSVASLCSSASFLPSLLLHHITDCDIPTASVLTFYSSNYPQRWAGCPLAAENVTGQLGPGFCPQLFSSRVVVGALAWPFHSDGVRGSPQGVKREIPEKGVL